MATLSPEEKVEFFINLLLTGEFTPNYGALAKEMDISTNANAQRRLKGIVEADKRFILKSEAGVVSVIKSGDAGDGKVDSDTSKKTPKSTKGRKRNKPATDDDDEEHNKTPSKVFKKTPKKDKKLSEGGLDNDQEQLSQNKDVV